MRSKDWPLLLILVAAIALRFAAILATDSGYTGDSADYRQLARSLVHEGRFAFENQEPTTLRAPGFPFFVAAIWGVWGESLPAILSLQVLLQIAALTVLALAFSSRFKVRLEWPLAALLLNPLDLFYCTRFLSETLTEGFMALGLAAALLMQRGRWLAAAAGACFGLAALCRDVYLLLPLAMFAAAAVRPVGETRWRDWWVPILGLMVTIAPWTVRNSLITGSLVPITKGLAGLNLWVGTWERDGSWQTPQGPVFPEAAFENEAQRADLEARARNPGPGDDAGFLAAAKQRLSSDPDGVLKTWLIRAPRMWVGTRTDLISFRPQVLPTGSKRWTLMKSAFWGLNLLILLAGVAAGLKAWWARREAAILFWPVLYSFGVYFPFHNTETRYSQPVLPALTLLACLLIWSVTRRTGAATALSATSVPRSQSVPDLPKT